jgi:hypothetical protein
MCGGENVRSGGGGGNARRGSASLTGAVMPKWDRETVEQKAKHAEIDRRYARHGKERRSTPKPFQVLDLRIAELRRLRRFWFGRRYGRKLPSYAKDFAVIMLEHLAGTESPSDRCWHFIKYHAPWFPKSEVTKIIDRPRQWKAGKLGAFLGLSIDERTFPGIRTIGARGHTKQDLQRARRKRQNVRRRKTGKTRQQYEAGSAAKLQPWKVRGMKERTWYRKGKP